MILMFKHNVYIYLLALFRYIIAIPPKKKQRFQEVIDDL